MVQDRYRQIINSIFDKLDYGEATVLIWHTAAQTGHIEILLRTHLNNDDSGDNSGNTPSQTGQTGSLPTPRFPENIDDPILVDASQGGRAIAGIDNIVRHFTNSVESGVGVGCVISVLTFYYKHKTKIGGIEVSVGRSNEAVGVGIPNDESNIEGEPLHHPLYYPPLHHPLLPPTNWISKEGLTKHNEIWRI